MKYLAIALATAALTGAQTPAISIRPNPVGLGGPALSGSRTGVPILGYLVGPGSLDLRAITGTGKAAQLGPSLILPTGVKHLFVPPREHFVLLESAASEPLALWLPASGVAASAPLPTAMPHPEIVAFSARGEAVALYAKSTDRLQVVSGLPGEAAVSSQPAIGKFGEPASFAVSDDGVVVVALLADGTAIASLRSGGWQRLPAAYGAGVMLFVPNSHSLVVSDAAQQTLTLLAGIGGEPQGARILAQGVVADRLAFTKEGDVLLAASSSQSKLWTVDLKTMVPRSVSSSRIDTLLPLRDGHTFLLSAPGVSLLNVPADSDSGAASVPVTH
jgi:hypothetical protein